MKTKHTAAWLSRHVEQQHSKGSHAVQYDRQFARNRMKAVMARHKRSIKLTKESVNG